MQRAREDFAVRHVNPMAPRGRRMQIIHHHPLESEVTVQCIRFRKEPIDD